MKMMSAIFDPCAGPYSHLLSPETPGEAALQALGATPKLRSLAIRKLTYKTVHELHKDANAFNKLDNAQKELVAYHLFGGPGGFKAALFVEALRDVIETYGKDDTDTAVNGTMFNSLKKFRWPLSTRACSRACP